MLENNLQTGKLWKMSVNDSFIIFRVSGLKLEPLQL